MTINVRKIYKMIKSSGGLSLFLAVSMAGVLAASVQANPSTVTIGSETLSLNKAIELVIMKNLTLQRSKYDLLSLDTNRSSYDKKYAWNLGLGGGYVSNKTPVTSSTTKIFAGDENFTFDVTASVNKMFNTGTSVSASVKHSQYGDNAGGAFGSFVIPDTADYYRPTFSVSIRQELLKNCFGINDRRMNEVFQIQEEIEKQNLYNLLSAVVVDALDAYWKVTVARESLENAKIELRNTENLRNIIARNSKIGLAEKFDINQYNALLSAAESKKKLAEFNYEKSVRDLLHQINMPADTKVTGVTTLTDQLPVLEIEKALAQAYKKRADFVGAQLRLNAAKINLKINENEALPSVSATLSASSNGQDTELGGSIGSMSKFENPSYSARIELKYPLWDTEIKTKARNSYFDLKRAEIYLEDLKQTVSNQVTDALEAVKLNHEVLKNNRNARVESERYYNSIIERSLQGKFNSVNVKNALDSMINSRQRELQSLVDFNIALLRFDLAKNEIFERYSINVEDILRRVKQ